MKKLGFKFIGGLICITLWNDLYFMEVQDLHKAQKIDYSTLLTGFDKLSLATMFSCDGSLDKPECILDATEKIIRFRKVSKDAEEKLTPEAIADFLIHSGAKLDSRNKRKYTALHLAAESGKVEVLKVLMAAHVDLDAVGLRGYTALHCAVAKGNVKCVELIVKSRARMNIGDSLGFTPLHIAAIKNQPECLKLLLNYGSVANAIDKFGGTALMLAVNGEHKESIEVLLDHYGVYGIEIPAEIKPALKKLNIHCSVQ